MSRTSTARGWFAVAFTLVGALWASTGQAHPLIVGNNSAVSGGPITTWDFATGGAPVASFVPTGAFNNNGRGLLVLGNKVYYTELSGLVGPTDFIRIALFNGGTGGADIGALPNPRPGTGVQDLAVSNGVLYAMTGYPFTAPLQVFGLNPITGAVVSGPVNIAAPASITSDGFTVLPNGNFLINNEDMSCTYSQYNPSTGASIPATAIVVPGGGLCTGVDTDGASLFFQTNGNSLTQTTLAGAFIASVAVTPDLPPDLTEDISLVTPGCAGAAGVTPGQPNCHGKCVSFLARTSGGMTNAASDLGFLSVADLQNAIRDFCGDCVGRQE